MHPVETESWTLSARWILPVSSPPLEGGGLTIAGGRIQALHPRGSFLPSSLIPHPSSLPESLPTNPFRRDLGDAVILPGLVNAHTHLDLTGLAGVAPFNGDFTEWLRTVIRHRRARSPEQVSADVRAGLALSLRSGVTLLGDIAGGGLSWPLLEAGPARSVVFYELLGSTISRAEAARDQGEAWLAGHSATPWCRPALSGHAPYSVHRDLFRWAAQRSLPDGAPLAVHLAETREEEELLTRRSGPFRAFLEELGVWEPAGLATSAAEVVDLCRGPRTLFIHANHLGADVELPANASVVYCPRTHAFFGHPPHPFRSLLARGVNVALGTDSLASNPDLDLLAEARFLHAHHPDVSPATLLEMATLNGARALGWEQTGSLEPGSWADLVVLGIPPGTSTADPERLVLENQLPVRAVMVAGSFLPVAGGSATDAEA
jgi:cytosine/adenosine deaminase-related metal-dependent hydrolase